MIDVLDFVVEVRSQFLIGLSRQSGFLEKRLLIGRQHFLIDPLMFQCQRIIRMSLVKTVRVMKIAFDDVDSTGVFVNIGNVKVVDVVEPSEATYQ